MNIRELEAQLAKAKKEEQEKAFAAELQRLKDTVENRVFAYISAGYSRAKNPRAQYIGFALYLNIRPHDFDKESFMADIESLSFSNKSSFWKSSKMEHDLRPKERLATPLDLGREIPRNIFNELKVLVLNKTNFAFDIAKKRFEEEHSVSFDYLKQEDTVSVLDAPHIQLEPYESTIIGESIFMLEGYRYLLTPNSIQAAKDKIYEEGINLFKGSQYYESCDWDYVTRRKESMDNILGKLNQ